MNAHIRNIVSWLLAAVLVVTLGWLIYGPVDIEHETTRILVTIVACLSICGMLYLADTNSREANQALEEVAAEHEYDDDDEYMEGDGDEEIYQGRSVFNRFDDHVMPDPNTHTTFGNEGMPEDNTFTERKGDNA